MLVNIKQLDSKLVLIFVILAIFLGCTNKILYHPPKVNNKLSKAYYYKYLDVNTTDGEALSVVKYVAPDTIPLKGTLLFLHGNADNITTLSSSLLFFVKNGYNLVLLDYRGYGKSTGSPSPKGLSIDINSTINFIAKDKPLFIYGQSIGATSLLGILNQIDKSKVKAIVTEGAFLSYKELSKEKGISVPFTNYKELDSYAPISTNKNISIPLMLIHSENDEVIPYSQGLALSKHFKNSKHLKITGKHLGFLFSKINFKKVFKFFDDNKNYQFVPIFKPIISEENNNNISKGVDSE